jgi:penicillin-binding protein 1A
MGNDARIGIEGVPETPDGHWIGAADVTWARRAGPDGMAGPPARAARDLLRVGEVVHVRALTPTDGRGPGWTLRQIPEVQGAFMAMDVQSGRVVALQGGFSYQHSAFNRATQALRQPGSAFKPVVFAAALESGFHPTSLVQDAPIQIETPEGIWRPTNASAGFYGAVPLWVGLEQSRNLVTVRLAHDLGIETVARYAERLGLYDRMGRHMATALGAGETTLQRTVAAYAMIANGGTRVEPVLFDRVTDRHGRTLLALDESPCPYCDRGARPPARGGGLLARGERVLRPATAYNLTQMLRGVVERGTARGRIRLPVPVAGKTGTTNDAKDVWFVGYTSTLAAGCYIGFDDPRSLGEDVYGATLCAPVFQDFMAEAVEKYGGGAFERPVAGWPASAEMARRPEHATRGLVGTGFLQRSYSALLWEMAVSGVPAGRGPVPNAQTVYIRSGDARPGSLRRPAGDWQHPPQVRDAFPVVSGGLQGGMPAGAGLRAQP